MTEVTHVYGTWQRLLATHGTPEPESEIGAGFWRLPSSKGHARPIATWWDDGAWQILRPGLDEFDSETGKGLFLQFMSEAWHRCQAWAEIDFNEAVDTGVWHDGVPAVPREGHNVPPADTLLAELIETLDALVAEATMLAKRGPATTQDQADVAANLKARIRTVRQEIVAAHKLDKAPVLDEGRRIDGLWFPHRDRAEKLEKRLHEVVVAPWLLHQRKLADEARAAAAAARKPPPDIPAAKAGATGMRDGLRKRWLGTIEDYDLFVDGVKDHDEVKAFMINYAQRIASNIHKIGATVPGLVTTEELV